MKMKISIYYFERNFEEFRFKVAAFISFVARSLRVILHLFARRDLFADR